MAIPNTFADKTGEVLLGNLDYNFEVLDVRISNNQTQIENLDLRIDAIEGIDVDFTGYATETYVNNAVSSLVNSAPSTLDTLNELAAALGDDANFSTTVTNSIAAKAPLASPTFTGTVSTQRILFNNTALVASDANNPSGTNIDHIWHNDAPNNTLGGTWHFVSDNAYQANGNSAISCGGIGVGTANIASGEVRATGDITAYYSDERLKTKHGNIENAIDKVNQLNGFYYEANDKAVELGYTKKREVGLSAQEIEKVLPEIVAPAPIDPEYKTIHYERVVPLLVEAIKELTARVKELENK